MINIYILCRHNILRRIKKGMFLFYIFPCFSFCASSFPSSSTVRNNLDEYVGPVNPPSIAISNTLALSLVPESCTF